MKTTKRLVLIMILIALLIGVILFCSLQPQKRNTVVVFDTDVGTDDALALLTARSAADDLFDYIVTAQGNTTLDGAVQNAVLLKKYLGLDAEIVQGNPPAADENVNAEEKNTFHGSDGLADIRAEMIRSLALTDSEREDYILFDDFAEKLAGCDEIVYIATGPTTNLTNLIENETIKRKISKVYIMGGGIHEFNCSNDTEFNFSKDPKSVKKILDSGLGITLFPLDLTNHQRLTSDQIDALEKTGYGAEFIRFLRFNLQSNDAYNRIQAAVLHDTMPVLYLVEPEKFRIEEMKISVDQYGSTKVSDDGALIHVAVGVEDSLLENRLLDFFSGKKKEN